MTKPKDQPEDQLAHALFVASDRHDTEILRDAIYRAIYDGKLRIKVQGQPEPLFLSVDTCDDGLLIECVMRKPDNENHARELFDLEAHANRPISSTIDSFGVLDEQLKRQARRLDLLFSRVIDEDTIQSPSGAVQPPYRNPSHD